MFVCLSLLFLIIIIFIATWTWLVLFGRRIIIYVTPLFMFFILLNLCFKILSEFIIFGNIFSTGLFIWILRIGLLM